ncbi:MAG: hypothetical protein M1818_003987 [Claussenomyces sp. TS43310]|nr:MAG: hypothetical protein M1818_003987 [Claussenomyces sp. TS43310]
MGEIVDAPRSAHGLILPETFPPARSTTQLVVRQLQRKRRLRLSHCLDSTARHRQIVGRAGHIQGHISSTSHRDKCSWSPFSRMHSRVNYVPNPENTHKRRRTDKEPRKYCLEAKTMPARPTEYNVDEVLRNQVFPHVFKSLQTYEKDTEFTSLKALGKKVCGQICANQDFYQNLKENRGTLSKLYEERIIIESQRLVAQFAPEYLKNHHHSKILGSGNGTAPDPHYCRPLSTQVISESHRGTKANEGIITGLPKAVFGNTDDDNDERFGNKRGHSTKISSCSESSVDRWYCPSPTTAPSIETTQKSRTGADEDSVSTSLSGLETADATSIETRNNAARIQRPTPVSKYQLIEAACFEQQASARPSRSTVHSVTQVSGHHDATRLRLAGLDVRIPRPYLRSEYRKDIARGFSVLRTADNIHHGFSEAYSAMLERRILHVDFCEEELLYVCMATSTEKNRHAAHPGNCRQRIELCMAGREGDVSKIQHALTASFKVHDPGYALVKSRPKAAVRAFLEDAAAGLLCERNHSTHLRLCTSHYKSRHRPYMFDSLGVTLFNRSIGGNHRFAAGRNHKAFRNRLTVSVEDTLVRRSEWSDCSGDLASFAWTPENGFVGGATAHLDEHNMQYNKPGNLLVGSVSCQDLVSVLGHRIPRPLVHKGDNALQSMRRTQDRFLYCSVTTIAYSQFHGKCFTGGFDNTVTIWNVDTKKLPVMEGCGTWQHDGHVNFVLSSPHHELIATASDVGQNAVRVYKVQINDISSSPFDTYSGGKVDEHAAARRASKINWAYHPATMQWGKSASVVHLLLVGYSPRSYDCQDEDIPEDKVNTGELCLWDTRDGSRILITSARTQNVFEVVWHPSQPIFVAATSPTGEFDEGIRTQLRLFGQTSSGSFSHLKTLDCSALDINEITVMPNSILQCYVSASCTDGNTYVWDTAQGERPTHVLSHGKSIDELDHDMPRERGDVGVKFAAWGRTIDRFYTGSSDGIVKAWNVRSPRGQEHIRDVVALSGGVSTGAWSPDFTKLVIGDSTGKVHLLSVDDGVGVDNDSVLLHRQPVTQLNPTLARSDIDKMDGGVEQTARDIAQEFVDQQQIVLHPDPYVGAIQGPAYLTTNLFCAEAHRFNEPSMKFIQPIKMEQEHRYRRTRMNLPRLPRLTSSSHIFHEDNVRKDLIFDIVPLQTRAEMTKEGLDFDFEEEVEEDNIIVDLQSFKTGGQVGTNAFPLSSQASLSLRSKEDIVIQIKEFLDNEVTLLKNFNRVLEEVYY